MTATRTEPVRAEISEPDVRPAAPATGETAPQPGAKLPVQAGTEQKSPPTEPTPAPTPSRPGKEPRQDPLAREALALVGVDAAAEQYWASAINDPSLSDKEREDLIEDLNEEGFVDPRHPAYDELPLIVSRLQIIEEYAPFAMDENNARSFAEAYKDLLNMFLRVVEQ